jgi:hypothetical protein
MDGEYDQRITSLQQTLDEIDRLREELYDSHRETDDLELQVETMHLSGQVGDFGYAIYQERLRRARLDINQCLNKLDVERLRALWRLFELEAD